MQATVTETYTCELCPRLCGADRHTSKPGTCGANSSLRVARAAFHQWEEPPISGTRGSGTVFFSNCSLRCIYCQNYQISRGKVGKAISVERLAEIFLELQAQGAHNINLVTPTHYVEEIIAALEIARRAMVTARKSYSISKQDQAKPHAQLTIPVVYNSSGYERVPTIDRLAGYVDIYLSDFKYASSELAGRYSQASDYPQVALAALKAMVEQVEEYRLDADGILQSGVIVRHLLLPGQLTDSKEVLRRVFAAVGNDVCYSLMSQFTPLNDATWLPGELRRCVDPYDYDELIDFALELGITNSFMQEGSAAQESFIPSFDLQGV